VVVVVQPLLRENRRLLLGEYPQRGVDFDVGLVSDQPNRLQYFLPLLGALLLRDALLGQHDAKTLGPVALGALCGLENLLRPEEAVVVDAGVEVDGLGTEATVLRAVARLRVDDRAGVDGVVAQLCTDVVRARGEFVHRLRDERQPVAAVQFLSVKNAADRVVYRSVACLVNHTPNVC